MRGMVPARREVTVILDGWGHLLNLERVCVPPGEPVESFDWSFLRRLSVLVAWRSDITHRNRAMHLVGNILAIDPVRLVLIDRAPTGCGVEFIKSVEHGVEVRP